MKIPTRHIILALSLVSAASGIALISRSTEAAQPSGEAPDPAIVSTESLEPRVAGAGIIEPSSQPLGIATQVGGVISVVHVEPGTAVRAGDPLFSLDDRVAKAALERARATAGVAKERLEDARVAVARAKDGLDRARGLAAARAVATEVLRTREFDFQAAEVLVRSREAELREALAAVASAELQLELMTVRSPISGRVLQVRARPGEYAPANALENPLAVVGQVQPLHVRIDIDEADIARLVEGAGGTISTRGQARLESEVEFVRFEPLVIPKRNLTGSTNERVDTRVLQVIYRLPNNVEGFYVGQQVDALVEGKGIDARTGSD